MDNSELRKLSKAYLINYADRYNIRYPDSRPSYSGFSEWSKKYSKSCPPFEKKLLKKLSFWLKVQNSSPSNRVEVLTNSRLEDFLDKAILQDLLSP